MEDKKLCFKLKMLAYETFVEYIFKNYSEAYDKAIDYMADNGLNCEVFKK